MAFYDVRFTVDGSGVLQSVAWGSQTARETYHLLFEAWIAQGRQVEKVFSLPRGQEEGTFSWDEDTFSFQFLPAPGARYLLLSRADERLFLFARALDHFDEGVQIYDKDAQAVFFNKASRKISRIPDGVHVEGRHLLDLYNLNEEISTTITALRTQSPVINRVDRFHTSNGASLATANTSFPILKEGNLVGAVVFEQTGGAAEGQHPAHGGHPAGSSDCP